MSALENVYTILRREHRELQLLVMSMLSNFYSSSMHFIFSVTLSQKIKETESIVKNAKDDDDEARLVEIISDLKRLVRQLTASPTDV